MPIINVCSYTIPVIPNYFREYNVGVNAGLVPL
jgi:hypothetical protein